MRLIRVVLVFGCLLALLLSVIPVARAGPYFPQFPFVNPVPGPVIPDPTNVPGKEYSEHWDKNTVPAWDRGQVINWDGTGGVMDGLDHDLLQANNYEDALASHADALFSSVINNTSALLFSVQTVGSIYFESIAGGFGTWAAPPQIDQHGVYDVDGLEVWGIEPEYEGIGDGDRYSREFDINTGVSVWQYIPAGPDVPVYLALYLDVADNCMKRKNCPHGL